MNRIAKAVITVALLAAAAALALYFWRQQNPPPPPPSEAEKRPAAPAATGPKFPVPEAPGAEEPLPKLDESDAQLRDALAALLGAQALERLFNLEDIVRRIVATIDNLPREKYASRLDPVKPIPELPRTTGKGDTLALDPANSARYTPLVRVMEAVDTRALVSLYVRYYPLFQQAYRELGYPEGHFNDRLVEVIDHLLATPQAPGPVKLVVTHVLYEFADPDLEALSAGQKVLLRIGPENAAKVKAKLRDIRAQVAAGAPQAR